MAVYYVGYGKAPYTQKTFTKWADAVKFIKELIDAGSVIHSISKCWSEGCTGELNVDS